MSREQFHKGLQGLQDGVLEMGSMVDRQIERAMQALIDRDIPLAEAVIRDDAEVNRTRFYLDNICLSLLAMQAPMASDLRLIVSVLSMITDLERMGDHAEGNAKIVLLMRDEPLVKPLVDIPAMASIARTMLKDVLDAFVQRDADAAYGRRPERPRLPGPGRHHGEGPLHRRGVHAPAVDRAQPRAHRRPQHEHRRARRVHGDGHAAGDGRLDLLAAGTRHLIVLLTLSVSWFHEGCASRAREHAAPRGALLDLKPGGAPCSI